MNSSEKDSISARIAALSPKQRTRLLKRLINISEGKDQGLLLQPGKQKGPFPLSLSQQRLWLLEQYRRQSPFLNAYRAWRLTGQLNIAALQQAMNILVKRHQVLRARFLKINNEPFQNFDTDIGCPLTIVDLTNLPASERENEALTLVTAEVKQPFSLEPGPVLRALLLHLAEQEYIFVINLDHLVIDGWSMGVLNREIGLLYGAAANRKPSPLTPLVVQYSDYCLWQRQLQKSAMLQKSLRYWVQQLTAAPVLRLPADRPRPGQSTHAGSRVTLDIPATLAQRLKRISQQHGVSLFMTLLAMFKVLVSNWSGQHDLLVGTPVAARRPRELESMVGLVVNHLPIRTDLSGNPAFPDVLDCVRQATLDAFSHQDVPFASIISALDITPEPGYHPLFQVFFTLQNSPNQDLTLPGLNVEPCLAGSVSPFNLGNDTAKFDMALSIVETHGLLRGVIEYSTELFERATITTMTDAYIEGLRRIIENPGQRISELTKPPS